MDSILASGLWVYAIVGLIVAVVMREQIRYYLRPACGLVFLVILSLPLDQFQFGGTWNLRPWNIILSGAGVLLLFRAIRGERIVLGSLAPILAFTLIASLVSFFNSEYLADSVRQIFKVLFVNLLIYLIAVNFLNSIEAVEAALRTWILASGVVALWGFIQLVAWLFFQQKWMAVVSFRPTAWFSEATWYGEYLVFSLALAIPFLIVREPKQKTVWLWLVVAFQMIGAFLSATRTSWASLISTFLSIPVLIFIIRQRQGKPPDRLIYRGLQVGCWVMTSLLVGFYVTSFVLPAFVPSFASLGSSAYLEQRLNLGDRSILGRVDSTRMTLLAALEQPFIGNGIGTWGRTFAGKFEGAVQIGGSHFNIFIGSFYDAGLLGLAAILWLIVVYGAMSVAMIRHYSSNSRFLRLTWACILSFISTMIISQLNPWYLTGLAWMGISLGFATWNVLKRFPSDTVVEAEMIE